ncbi:transcription antitermination factor NusB [Hoylesella loescheii]|uniref:Transcription antitermination factor NusB n=1 Tax=Hoylesella loescheii DSM 19665 = JCM 12249 = ATCC 15930 TaxID=1122985 RepID=A0A069QGF6_HOYLO|nr:transcription antitermination factor NusB [Hoylesella loescheii]KDR51948.1 transcription antitermination factor NusB [Hoylesella loescheii DSM 19665 = JCM 12249 = ATCC 15930]
MINRELIRIKIVQLTYAYYQNGNRNMDNAEKELLFSLSKAYDLYNYLLALIVAIMREERHRVDIATQQAQREGTEVPSPKFAYNKFATQLEENKQLNDFMETLKQRWEDDIEAVRKLCNQIEQSEIYREYMESDDDSYEADREVWRKLYKQLVQNNVDLDALLEEKSLYWNDDKEIVDTFVLKTIKRFDPANKAKQELLPEYKDEEDKDFARKLFRSTILNADQYQRYMSENSRNWDFSRLAYMDVVIMQIAIAEMLTFPNIPVSVTINEYVELAKLYSTHRSGGYINGMLDTIARGLIAHGQMMKAMPDPRPRKHIGHDHKNGEQRQEQHPAHQSDASVEEVVNIDNEAHADAVNGDIQPTEAVEARAEEA